MSPPIISVENISKCYLVGHRSERSGPYIALRDVLAQETRNAVRKALDVVRGRQVVQGDTVEEFWALRNLSFEVQQGEVLGIIGRNGAGKSTLLKILSRITEPTEGRVTLRGRVASLLEVGTGFHPELTGRENIFLNGAILGMTQREIRQKFDEIVSFAEVEKFIDTPVKRYSSGMYVRLAFSVAAHLEPEIMIVDEVLAVGDVAFQTKCLGKMNDVAGSGRTVLFVSHNLAALKRVCQSGMLLKDGVVADRGTVEQCISAYTEQDQERRIFRRRRLSQANGRGEITRLSIQTVECLSGSVLQGGKFALQVEVDVVEPTRKVVFGVGFCDAVGGRILSSDSDYIEMRDFSFPKAGRYALTLQLNNLPLAAANYTLDVGCRFANGPMIDNIQGALTISVLPSMETTIVQTSGFTTALLPGVWELVT